MELSCIQDLPRGLHAALKVEQPAVMEDAIASLSHTVEPSARNTRTFTFECPSRTLGCYARVAVKTLIHMPLEVHTAGMESCRATVVEVPVRAPKRSRT